MNPYSNISFIQLLNRYVWLASTDVQPLAEEVQVEYDLIHAEMIQRNNRLTALESENADLRLQLQQAREQLAYAPIPVTVTLDSTAIEPTPPTGLPAFWFEINTGPYKAEDTFIQRQHLYSYGPFASWSEANEEWKAYLKRQRENGRP